MNAMASSETTRAVLDASERLTSSLNFKTGHVHDEFVDLADRVHEMLNERIDRITAEFESRSATIVDGISDRTEQVHDSLKNSSDSLLLELELRSGDLVSKIDEAGNRLAGVADVRRRRRRREILEQEVRDRVREALRHEGAKLRRLHRAHERHASLHSQAFVRGEVEQLVLHDAPPLVAPNWLKRSGSVSAANTVLASSASLRMNS